MPMRLVLRIAGLVLGLGLVAGAAFLWIVQEAAKPGPLTEATTVSIERGASVSQIAQSLKAAEVIRSPILFRVLVRLRRAGTGLIAGEYRFEPGASLDMVIDTVRRGAVTVYKVTIPEGLTAAEVVARLAQQDILTGRVDTLPPEGSLLPDTYQVHRGDTRQSVLDRMQAAMTATLDALWAERAEGLPLASKQEAVVLASIVEKETALPDERRRVAGVFINRLNANMRLQTDPTVIYALTQGAGPLGRPLTRRDLSVDSPYNTYLVDGLPPGPIANPGRAALAAVLDPERHDYLFFVADGSGGHAFARTLAEHNRNVAAWRRVRDGD